MFSSLTFNIITDKVEFNVITDEVSVICLFVFYESMSFFLTSFSLLRPPFVLNRYFLVYHFNSLVISFTIFFGLFS